MKEKISKDEFFMEKLEKRCVVVSVIITAVIVILLIILLGAMGIFGQEVSSTIKMIIDEKYFRGFLAIVLIAGLCLFESYLEKKAREKKLANKKMYSSGPGLLSKK